MKNVNRITFENRTDIQEILKFNIGIKPTYGNKGSTMRGCAWCLCGKCVSDLLSFIDNTVIGWFDIECSCGNQIDWSEANEHL